MSAPGNAGALAWLSFAAWSALIFATVPFARALEKWVVAHAGAGAFLIAVLALIALAAALGWRAVAKLGARARIALALGVVVYASTAWRLRGNAVEAVHLVEYGVLGLLALRALAPGARDSLLAPGAALLGVSVGLVDEALQWLAPARVWDLRDVGVNALAASGGPALLALGVQPPWSLQRPSRASALRFLALFALTWLLLGASLLNTSARIAWLARFVPGLGALEAQETGMVDYGVRHALASAGEFPSRLRAEEWTARDRECASEAGALLAARAGEADYDAFLAEYSAVRDPFLHELRVHLFRRDRYLATADRHLDDPPWRRRDLTVAVRENAFLEAFAPRVERGAARRARRARPRHALREPRGGGCRHAGARAASRDRLARRARGARNDLDAHHRSARCRAQRPSAFFRPLMPPR